ncbi:MAG: glycoside hydrolase family 73 protein [Saprospiraceae bacterium]
MTNQTLHTSCQEGALQRALLFLGIFFLGSINAFSNYDPPNDLERQAFIEEISRIAQAQQQLSGIPASITAAQAIFESSWGKSPLATTGNNYFGIKCKSWWVGETILHKDDDYNEKGELTYSCFRAYESMDDSFNDHSVFLLANERYAPLFKLDPTDYKAWSHGLKKCGYATDPKYAQKLIRLIERLNLQGLDQPALATIEAIRADSTKVDVKVSSDASPFHNEKTPPPPMPIPDSYVPSGKGERPVVRRL